MSVRDDLIAARALIDTPEKWGRKQFADLDGKLCIRGACGQALGGAFAGRRARGAEVALLLALPEGFPSAVGPLGRLATFNDAPSTTHADVMALFDRAIAAQPVGEETRAQPAPDDFVLF